MAGTDGSENRINAVHGNGILDVGGMYSVRERDVLLLVFISDYQLIFTAVRRVCVYFTTTSQNYIVYILFFFLKIVIFFYH